MHREKIVRSGLGSGLRLGLRIPGSQFSILEVHLGLDIIGHAGGDGQVSVVEGPDIVQLIASFHRLMAQAAETGGQMNWTGWRHIGVLLQGIKKHTH